MVAARVPGRAEEAPERFGFAPATRDRRKVAADPRVRAVDVTVPDVPHRETGVAPAAAGEHLLPAVASPDRPDGG